MYTAIQYLDAIFFPYNERKLFQFKYLNKLVALVTFYHNIDIYIYYSIRKWYLHLTNSAT